MALKYVLEINSVKGDDWKVEIDVDGYVGETIELIAPANPISISYEGNNDDNPFNTHIVPQSASFSVYSDIEELQIAEDAMVVCRVYLNNNLKHQGFLLSDGIQENISDVASVINFKSTDGLTMLRDRRFRWFNNYGTITVNGETGVSRCPLNAFRLALYNTNSIVNLLPIRWNSTLKSVRTPDSDMLSGEIPIDQSGVLFGIHDKSIWWVLESLLQSSQSWLYQRDGIWYIENKMDTILNDGVFDGYQITSSNPVINQTATSVTVDFNKGSVDDMFINQDPFKIIKKPFGGVNVIYEALTNDRNVIPNGDFSSYSLGGFPDWIVKTPSSSVILSAFQDSDGFLTLDNRPGYSMDCSFPASTGGTPLADSVIGNNSGVPLDANVLFKGAEMGFDILPLTGFTYDSNGNIDWSKKELNIRVSYIMQDSLGNFKTYYLNSFGFWVYLPLSGFMTMAITNPSSKTWTYTFANTPVRGDVINIKHNYTTGMFSQVFENSYIVSFSEEGNLSTLMTNLKNYLQTELGTSFWTVTNTSNSITVASSLGGTLIEGGSTLTTGSSTVNADGSIPIEVGSGKIGDVIGFRFTGKGGNSLITLPDPGDLSLPLDNGKGNLTLDFFIKDGQRYVLDNVYFRVNENNDKYEIRIPNSKSPVYDYTLGISSSYSGHILNNYMVSYYTSKLSLNWEDSQGYEASLTELYGVSVLDWLGKPKKVIDTEIDDYIEFGDIITVEGIKYGVLSSTLQSDGISKSLSFEYTLDRQSYEVTHKGTNDSSQ